MHFSCTRKGGLAYRGTIAKHATKRRRREFLATASSATLRDSSQDNRACDCRHWNSPLDMYASRITGAKKGSTAHLKDCFPILCILLTHSDSRTYSNICRYLSWYLLRARIGRNSDGECKSAMWNEQKLHVIVHWSIWTLTCVIQMKHFQISLASSWFYIDKIWKQCKNTCRHYEMFDKRIRSYTKNAKVAIWRVTLNVAILHRTNVSRGENCMDSTSRQPDEAVDQN